VHTLGYFKNPSDINDYNIAWDHTCNIVVTAPNEGDSIFTVNQVSEYDGAQRFQPNYEIQEGWKKIRGPGGLDYGNFKPSWALGKELNCGDECLFYSLEEQVETSDILPRYLIGRSYRSGNVNLNITDSLQVRSLSFNPFLYRYPSHVNQFLGIGQCCTEKWCHQDCENLGQNLVLLSFLPSSRQFTILADIGEMDPATIRMGVEFSALWTNDFKAYVFYKSTVISFDLTLDNGVVLKAIRSNQSPPINDFNLAMWANSGY